jgi:hypothetical protein
MLTLIILVLVGFVLYRGKKNSGDFALLGIPSVSGFLLGGAAYFLFGEPDYWQYGAMAGGMAGLIVGLLIANKRELDAKKKFESAWGK